MSRIRYNEQNYIYGSVRVEAIERNAIGAERFIRAAEAKSYEESVRILEETSLKLGGNVEECINSLLEAAYGVLDELAPNPEIFDVLRYPYDCHNIKSAIKSSISASGKASDYENMLFAYGRVSNADIISAVRERNFSALPENMAQAAEKAFDVYYRTRDPQQIDLMLDGACYDDMAACAAEYGVKFMRRYVEYRADATNILTAVRLIRMSAPYPLLKRVMVGGGKLSASDFADCYSAETARAREAKVLALAAKYDYRLGLSDGASLTDIEKACDQLTLDFVSESAAGKLAGAELLCNFVLKRETEAKNIRIVLSGKSAGLGDDTIKSRLRV